MTGADESDRHPELDRKLRTLARCELFSELPPRELRRLARSSVLLRLAKGRPLLEPGRLVSALYLMVEGSVTLYRPGADDRSVIVNVVKPGDAFDEAALVSTGEVGLLAETDADSVVCSVPRVLIHELLADHPEFRTRVIERIARRLFDVQQRMVEVAYAPVPVRVALSLLRASHDGTDQILLRHSDIASIAGTNRETVTKLLNDMRLAGLLELGRGRIVVLDREGLVSIAEGRA